MAQHRARTRRVKSPEGREDKKPQSLHQPLGIGPWTSMDSKIGFKLIVFNILVTRVFIQSLFCIFLDLFLYILRYYSFYGNPPKYPSHVCPVNHKWKGALTSSKNQMATLADQGLLYCLAKEISLFLYMSFTHQILMSNSVFLEPSYFLRR